MALYNHQIGSNDSSDPKDFQELLPSADDFQIIHAIHNDAIKYGTELLLLINKRSKWDEDNIQSKNRYLQIATSESLTCGLIMSTLVDIPWGGYMKYGGFGVYDTNAKRVFNGVEVENVYTHECAEQMAVGILKNSNATIAIAVTGNAMPFGNHSDMLGEVFIGIAGYNSNGDIMVSTRVVNACDQTNIDTMNQYCKDWITVLKTFKFNLRTNTATISKLIRYFTVIKAYQFCAEFIEKMNPVPIDIVFERTNRNIIPPPKFDLESNKQILNVNNNMCDTNNKDDCEVKPTHRFKISGGKKTKKIRNKKYNRRESRRTKFQSFIR
jgi:nicotinamide mononucleotide (NMN) deamidase PncC